MPDDLEQQRAEELQKIADTLAQHTQLLVLIVNAVTAPAQSSDLETVLKDILMHQKRIMEAMGKTIARLDTIEQGVAALQGKSTS
jgi:t-SNARE complex subunit (syntaxin)